jgi:hypothetical protein
LTPEQSHRPAPPQRLNLTQNGATMGFALAGVVWTASNAILAIR